MIATVVELTTAISDASISDITVTPGAYYLVNSLSIGRSVRIRAQVPGSVVFDMRGQAKRVMSITQDDNAVIELSGLNMTGARLTGGGGGLIIGKGTVVLEECVVYDNTATLAG